MEAAINSLPDEILERIFSYCSHSDLVHSIQNVCCRWREMAQSTRVWTDVTYCPERNTRYEQVVEMLEISPKLQNIILRCNYDDRVLQAITNNCSELRNLELGFIRGIDMNFIKNLQEKCLKVEYLKIPGPGLADLEKCELVGKFTNLKVLHLSGGPLENVSVILKPVANYCKKLEHVDLATCHFEMNDLRYLLSMRKDTLHTLGVSCCDKFRECVLPALSACKLKSLSLFYYSFCDRRYKKVEDFGHLKTVRALSISNCNCEHDFKQIFENENMAQLVELSIEHSIHFVIDDAEVIVRSCPLLKYVSLKYLYYMSDATIKIITNLKELTSLTISHNINVTSFGILHLQDVKSLKCLRILRCDGIILRNIVLLSTLQDLSLEEQDLAEFPWDIIPHHMQYLQCLRLRHCRNVNMCAIEKLKIQLPSLKVLN